LDLWYNNNVNNLKNFGSRTKEIILNNFGIDNIIIFNIEIVYCLLITISSPINLFPIYSIVYENKKINKILKKYGVELSNI
jgi:hypothetical protein